MNNKQALLMTTIPILIILFLGIGVRFFSHEDDFTDRQRRAARERERLGIRRPTVENNPDANADRRPTPPAVPADPETQKAIEKSVRGQITAITKRDYAGALGFAEGLMRTYMRVEEFKGMIEAEFPALRTAKTVQTPRAMLREDRAALIVTVTDGDNTPTKYRYILKRERGQWRISTVSPFVPQQQAMPAQPSS